MRFSPVDSLAAVGLGFLLALIPRRVNLPLCLLTSRKTDGLPDWCSRPKALHTKDPPEPAAAASDLRPGHMGDTRPLVPGGRRWPLDRRTVTSSGPHFPVALMAGCHAAAHQALSPGSSVFTARQPAWRFPSEPCLPPAAPEALGSAHSSRRLGGTPCAPRRREQSRGSPQSFGFTGRTFSGNVTHVSVKSGFQLGLAPRVGPSARAPGAQVGTVPPSQSAVRIRAPTAAPPQGQAWPGALAVAVVPACLARETPGPASAALNPTWEGALL